MMIERGQSELFKPSRQQKHQKDNHKFITHQRTKPKQRTKTTNISKISKTPNAPALFTQ
jgi:hypothetical protein